MDEELTKWMDVWDKAQGKVKALADKDKKIEGAAAAAAAAASAQDDADNAPKTGTPPKQLLKD